MIFIFLLIFMICLMNRQEVIKLYYNLEFKLLSTNKIHYRSKTSRTIDHMRIILGFSEEYHKKHSKWPSRYPLTPEFSNRIIDAWGHRIKMHTITTGTLRVTSYGKDGFRNTGDDITIDLFYNGREYRIKRFGLYGQKYN